MFRIGAWQVDLIDDRDDLKPIIQRKVYVCKRLRFNALRGVHNKHRTFACCERAGNFVRKVYVARRVDEVEHVLLAIGMRVEHPHSRGFDCDAALTLNVHCVEHLRLHITQGDGVRQLHHAVGQGGFPVVDVCDDAKVPNQVLAVCHRIPPSFIYFKFAKLSV